MPKSYSHVDLVADCYRDFSIKQVKEKNLAHQKRSSSNHVQSSTMLPGVMEELYSNGENKNRLIDLTFDFMKDHSSKSLSLLKCNTIFSSADGICERISEESVTFYKDLSSD